MKTNIITFMDDRGHIRRVKERSRIVRKATLTVFGNPVSEASATDKEHTEDHVWARPIDTFRTSTLSSKKAVSDHYKSKGLDPKTGRPIKTEG